MILDSTKTYAELKPFADIVDSEHYKMWLPAEEVYDGSNALHLSIRASRG